eukprot:159583-Lingulodinium_polyedra.AAC.1
MLVAWQICGHAILSAALYDKAYVVPQGRQPAFYNTESSTVASVVGATGPAPPERGQAPDYAKKADVARVVCRSMLDLFIRERCLLFT